MTTLIPAPTSIELASGAYELPARVRVGGAIDAVVAVVDGTAARLSALTGREWSVAPDSAGEVRLVIGDIAADFEGIEDTYGASPHDGDPRDERYVLQVDAGGVEVRATAPEGLARGLATLTQLAAGSDGGSIPFVRIVDAPRFAWRGLSLDVVRSFFTPEQVTAVVDMLAMHKMNVLHLHLSDDQGWRIEVPALPRLTEVASSGAVGNRPGGFYTVEQYRSIVEYAAERFVTIVPEVDVPGHTAAVLTAYPELGPEHPPVEGATYLDPDRPGVDDFVAKVFNHLASVTPGAYIHVGGDEPFGMPHDLYEKFLSRALPLARATGKKVIGWQEISRGALTAADTIQYWIHGIDPDALPEDLPPEMQLSPERMAAIAEQFAWAGGDLGRAERVGSAVVLSPVTVAYLDAPHGDASVDPAQDERRQALGLRVYAARSLEQSYDWDPGTIVPEVEAERVHGLEAAIWCETIESVEDLHLMLMPRLVVFAEKAWSAGEASDWSDYANRLAAQAPIWRNEGWHFLEAASVDWR